MYIIAGLGNPGNKYEGTRHNIGFHTIDYIADAANIKVNKIKYKGLCGEGNIEGERVLLLKPQTFMNLSGQSIILAKEYYSVPNNKLIVIYDDASLEPGSVRVRLKGSDGGHNGIKSILCLLGSDEFPRIKLGIGAKPHPDMDLADYVLGHFSKDEIPVMEDAIKLAQTAINIIIKSGVNEAMNNINGL